MPEILRTMLRLFVGAVGCFWAVGGIIGLAVTITDHAWAPMLAAAVTVLIGYCVAYWAFVRAPWEREASNGQQAT